MLGARRTSRTEMRGNLSHRPLWWGLLASFLGPLLTEVWTRRGMFKKNKDLKVGAAAAGGAREGGTCPPNPHLRRTPFLNGAARPRNGVSAAKPGPSGQREREREREGERVCVRERAPFPQPPQGAVRSQCMRQSVRHDKAVTSDSWLRRPRDR
ncbi:hypothetical protein T484DRAFT_2704138 [Baffinella frigidus]|nr:hypothetical protein T484DRAFT_2704138 [Cryptophyta sp. CCMP2293]